MTLFDCEANGFLDVVTKLHCICAQELGTGKVWSMPYNTGVEWLMSQPILVGHGIIDYDLPVIEKLTGCVYSGYVVDTLILARHLKPGGQHELENYGRLVGINKPEVDDWSDQPIEVYLHRCQEDVKINVALLQYFRDEYGFNVTPDLAVKYKD